MQATHSRPVHPENGLVHIALPTERFALENSAFSDSSEVVAVLNGVSARIMYNPIHAIMQLNNRRVN